MADADARVTLKRVDAGPHKAVITLHSNCADRAPVQRTVKWHAVAPVEFEPHSIDFGTLRPEQVCERTVAIIVRDERGEPSAGLLGKLEGHPPVKLAVSWDDETVSVQPGRRSRKVRIVLRPGSDLGEQHGNVSAALSERPADSASLPVRWSVRDVIDASPSSLFLGSANAEAVLAKKLTISAREGDDLEVVVRVSAFTTER